MTQATASPGTNEFTFSKLSCRSGALTVAAGWAGSVTAGASITVQIAEATADPQLISVADAGQATFHFKLGSGPTYIEDWYSGGNVDIQKNGDAQGAENVYYKGTFDCFTLNGLT